MKHVKRSDFLSTTDEELLKKYTILGMDHPDFFKWWRAVRMETYYQNKKAGKSDPFDVFDDYTSPILKKD